jgi:hypothetical protein
MARTPRSCWRRARCWSTAGWRRGEARASDRRRGRGTGSAGASRRNVGGLIDTAAREPSGVAVRRPVSDSVRSVPTRLACRAGHHRAGSASGSGPGATSFRNPHSPVWCQNSDVASDPWFRPRVRAGDRGWLMRGWRSPRNAAGTPACAVRRAGVDSLSGARAPGLAPTKARPSIRPSPPARCPRRTG